MLEYLIFKYYCQIVRHYSKIISIQIHVSFCELKIGDDFRVFRVVSIGAQVGHLNECEIRNLHECSGV